MTLSWQRVWPVVGLLALPWPSQTVQAQVTKGFQILIDHGFQVQGMVNPGDPFHLNTYSNANYNSIHWLWDSNPSLMGAAPGFPWSRWAADETKVPPQGGEGPYMTQLVSLQLGDEWHLNDDATRTRLVNWFNAVRGSFPNTILFHNNYGGQVGDAPLGDYIVRAQPDMLSFDTYPWRSNGSGTSSGNTPIHWYGDLRRWREHAKGANIPLACYIQTYHSVSEMVRDPSPSELRLTHFGAMAFNAKTLIDFTYNTGASSFFNNAAGGDNSPNALYAEKADCALRARHLGKALVRLKPIADGSPTYTTSIMFLRGRDASGAVNPIPIGFIADAAAPDSYTDWLFQRNDPHLVGWTVMNKGVKNGGNIGDVIISWFKPLDESFDGPAYVDQIYMMVVNGLCATNGTAADCLQEIKLNFVNAFTALDMLDPASGQLTNVTLPVVNTRRQLVLNLNGGDAALFKFANGAQFVGFPAPTNAPVITSQPVSLTNVVGTTAEFSVTAAGQAPLSYRWRFNAANISGATASSYTLPSVQTNNAGSYTVVITNNHDSVTSEVATLTVRVPPQITTQPQSRVVLAGSNVLFTVAATGTAPLNYQWRFNGTNISGATAASYTRTNAQAADAGNYSVMVSNAADTVLSSNAALTVNSPPSIKTQPQNQAVTNGSAASFNAEAEGTAPLSYRWQKDGAPLFDGGTISGAATLTLMLSNVQNGDAGNYRLAVSNAFGAITSAPAALSIATQPAIQLQPQSRTNNAGTTATFTIAATGGGLIFQWRKNGTNLSNGGKVSGASSDTLVLSGVTKPDAAPYTVFVSNADGNITSAPATLTVAYPLPFHEPFHHSAGANLGGQISPDFLTWSDVGTNTAGPYVTVQTGNLSVANLAPASGNCVHFGGLGKSARLSMPAPFTNGTVYYSFALRVLDLTGASASGGFIAGFNNSIGAQGNPPTVVGTRVYLRTAGGGFNLGVAKNSSTDTDWVWSGTVFQTNQTIFLVGSYAFTTVGDATDDVAKLWINPSAAAFGAANPPPPTLIATTGSDMTANQIASFVYFQRSASAEPALMQADELRIDTSWAGVTPGPVPPHIDSIIVLPDGRVQLQGSADPGHFSIEASADLEQWSELTNYLLPSSPWLFLDSSSSNASKRFYRAVSEP